MSEASARRTAERPLETANTTIPACLGATVARDAELTAVVDGDLRVTYGQLAVEVSNYARALAASGVQPGDRVAIWAPNSAKWITTALAIYSAGATLIPLNTRFKGDEAAYIVMRSGARIVFTEDGFLGLEFSRMLRESEVLQQDIDVVSFDASPTADTAWARFIARGADTPAEQIESRSRALTGESLSEILFTSGTTGQPKGVMLTHGASVRAYTYYAWRTGMRPRDRYLLVNPLSHAFALKAGMLASIITGITLIVHRSFNPETIMESVSRERITFLPGTPAMFTMLLNHPGLPDADMSSVRTVAPGGAVVTAELVERIRREIGAPKVSRGYGLTESTGIVATQNPDADVATISESCGAPIDGVTVRVVDESGAEVEAGTAGEIRVRGYTVMSGYLDDPAATAAAIDQDGWLHTGDIGLIDDKGNIRIVDRLKDMYLVGGFNAYPAEIERVIAQHEAVAHVAVIGMPDDRLGEVGAAFIVCRPGSSVDSDEVIGWCRSRLANYKVPRKVVVLTDLPMNATGKVRKPELRKLL